MKTLVLTLSALLFASPAFAHPGGHGGGHGSAPGPEEPTSAPSPDTLAGIVRDLVERHAAATTALEKHKVADVQRAATRMGELADDVPDRSRALAPEQQSQAKDAAARIRAQVNVVLEAALAADKERGAQALSAAKVDIDALKQIAAP